MAFIRYTMPMKNIIITIFYLSIGLSTASHAQSGDWKSRRDEIRSAFDVSDRGQLSQAELLSYSNHPLYSWLEVNNARKRIGPTNMMPADRNEIERLIQRYNTVAAGDWLRALYLGYLVKQEDWASFSRFYRESKDPELRCGDLKARLQESKIDAQWQEDAKAMWLNGKSLPNACDAVFTRLAELGGIDSNFRWQRIELAIAESQTGLIRALAAGLPAEDAALAKSYADYIDSPNARYSSWPKNARSRAAAVRGLTRLAKRSPELAEQQVIAVSNALDLSDAERGRVLNEAALWTVASYGPESAQRLNAVPEAGYDEKLHEWRVREAISRGDDRAALAGIEKMGAVQRNDSRWQYFEARLRERLNQITAAKALYIKAAMQPNFHGWLAADKLNQPYVLCPLEPISNPALRQRLAADPRLIRAFELFSVDRLNWALKEWNAALDSYSPEEKKLAIALAQKENWYDRAVFSMGSEPNDSQYYSLRFPLHHESDIRQQAKVNALDPAWVAGQTRAESIFMPRVRSGADARGLMQLLPGTGAQVSARLGMPWRGAESLYEPETNIILGTAYIRQMLDRYNGFPYLAIAAYNAGPAPISRWQAERPALEPDFWIEAIPYKETRDYVSRVLAFSVIYDWRLDKTATSLTDRMLGRFNQSQRRAFVCPAAPVAETLPAQNKKPARNP
jgi:soluble lytic murein transglycosylase